MKIFLKRIMIDCGHYSEHVFKAFKEIGCMTREEARKSKRKVAGNLCIFATKFNPHLPNISLILKKYRSIIDGDERAKQVLPEGSLRVSYKRGRNLKELLAPSNPFKDREKAGTDCFACTARRCDCCKNFLLPGGSFCSVATGKNYVIRKSLTCTSPNVVYLAHCVICNFRRVGSTINFKSRLVN